jgi:DivIVA domain-containing protein
VRSALRPRGDPLKTSLPTALRGYQRSAVDAFLVRCARALGARLADFPELAPHGRSLRDAEPVTAHDVRDVRFPVVLRGYDLAAIDLLLRRVQAALAEDAPAPAWAGEPVPPAIGPGPALRSAARGYAREEVDGFFVQCAHSLGERVGRVPELAALTGRPRTGVPLTARDVENVQFRMVLRGYAPGQVDDLLDRVAAELKD